MLQEDEGSSFEIVQEIQRVIFPESNEDKYLRRKDLVRGLEEKKLLEDLAFQSREKGKAKIWLDCILFVVQKSFMKLI